LRFPNRASGLLAAAALAGAVVYWRAADRRRSQQFSADIEAGVEQGQKVAEKLLKDSDKEGSTV
jgi:hypothetical protein